MPVHSRIPLISQLMLQAYEENSPKSGNSQGLVHKGLQKSLYVDCCGVSCPFVSYTLCFFSWKDSWTTFVLVLRHPAINWRDSRQFIHTLLYLCNIFVCALWIKFYSQVKESYINFLNHCYIDTEVEMKEIYTSNHMWSLFEKSFLVDMGHVANATHDRKHADTALENYIINSVMNIISTFFNSPFSDQSTTVQVGLLPLPVN